MSSISYKCPWCGKDQEFDTSEGFNLGPNPDDCDSCGKPNVVYIDVTHYVTHAVKDLPHKTVTCQNCGLCLDSVVSPNSELIRSLCPKCRQTYSIKIERIEEVEK